MLCNSILVTHIFIDFNSDRLNLNNIDKAYISRYNHVSKLLRFQPQSKYSLYHKSPDPYAAPVTVSTTISIQYIPQVS